MGRTFIFECPKCAYRAKVSGGADRGVGFWTQTILCYECKQLHDSVTKMRVPDPSPIHAWRAGMGWRATPLGSYNPKNPPTFATALNRLPSWGVPRFKWVKFNPVCPVSSYHRLRLWNEPDKCPKCGSYMEKNALPYRIWE